VLIIESTEVKKFSCH